MNNIELLLKTDFNNTQEFTKDIDELINNVNKLKLDTNVFSEKIQEDLIRMELYRSPLELVSSKTDGFGEKD